MSRFGKWPAIRDTGSVNGCPQCEHLERALASRDVIAAAKGLIMERFGLDRDEAWKLLVRLSQSSNLRVTEIATRLVTVHEDECRAGATASPPCRTKKPPRPEPGRILRGLD